MDLESYLLARATQQALKSTHRQFCLKCIQPEFSCYCRHIQSFDPRFQLVILIHPIEVRRRVATGRMSHLVLQGSQLIAGQDYSENPQVNAWTKNPENQCLLLYPGKSSVDVSQMTLQQRAQIFDPSKKLVLFVIDGTWATAKKMVRQSENLSQLPRIGFTPANPSRFRVRKQPKAHCLSTIEAIHETIELIGPLVGFSTVSREHDKLLRVFDKMVERQLQFVERSINNPEYCRYHRARQVSSNISSDR